MKYKFKPKNDITMYEIIEIVRAMNFEIKDLIYEQMTRGHRHFEQSEGDTLAEPRESPYQPQFDPQEIMIAASKSKEAVLGVKDLAAKVESIEAKLESFSKEFNALEEMLSELSDKISDKPLKPKQSRPVNFGSRI